MTFCCTRMKKKNTITRSYGRRILFLPRQIVNTVQEIEKKNNMNISA